MGNESPNNAQTFVSGRKAGAWPKFAANFPQRRGHPNFEKNLSKLWPGPTEHSDLTEYSGSDGRDFGLARAARAPSLPGCHGDYNENCGSLHIHKIITTLLQAADLCAARKSTHSAALWQVT